MKALTKLPSIFLVFFLSFIFCSFLSFSYADIPRTINYQGKLTDKQGYPLDGSYDISFRLYDTATAGNPLWQEAHTAVSVSKGLFSVLLGTVTPLNLPFDKQYYLGIKVGADPEMTPRQQLASSPYAITAERGVPRGVVVMWSGNIANIPLGWALCDGTNGTPDLRNKFIVGAAQDDSGIAKTDISGSLTQGGGSSNHAHTGTTASDASGNYRAWNASPGESNNNADASRGWHTHAFTVDNASSLPPYYALAYIMKL